MKNLSYCWSFLVLIVCLYQNTGWGTYRVFGTVPTKNESAPTIGLYAWSHDGQRLVWSDATPALGDPMNMAISINAGMPSALVPETVTLNNEKNKPNPVQGKSIACLTLSRHKAATPIFCVSDDPKTLYFIDAAQTANNQINVSMASITQINDAMGNPGDIHALACMNFDSTQFIFAAISPAGKSFGEPGSGIAVIRFIEWTEDVEDINAQGQRQKRSIRKIRLATTDAQTGLLDGNRAYAVHALLDAHGVHFDQLLVDMYVDPTLQRLYISFQWAGCEAGPLVPIIVGHIKKTTTLVKHKNTLIYPLICTPMMSTQQASALLGTSTSVSSSVRGIKQTRFMQSSTGLSYALVMPIDMNETKTIVKAFPVVRGQRITHGATGVLALPSPTTKYAAHYPYRYKHRMFECPAADYHSLEAIADEQRCIVGGGPVPCLDPAAVVRLFSVLDTVYVVVKQTSDSNGAVYSAQALFDAQGCIMGWTPWQMHVMTDLGLHDAYYDYNRQAFWILAGASTTAHHVIDYTTWNSREQLREAHTATPYVALLMQELPREHGGILSLTDVVLPHGSVLVATGAQKVVLVQTTKMIDSQTGQPLPWTDDGSLVHHAYDGSLHSYEPAPACRIMSITGGVVTDLGLINAVEFALHTMPDGSPTYLLFIAGVNGLAVLIGPDGAGWPAADAGRVHTLSSALTFKKISAFPAIKKIMADDRFLYIMTPHYLQRLSLDALTDEPHTLLTPALLGLSEENSFNDCIISHGTAVLATTAGLYETTTLNSFAPAWKAVPLPECSGGVKQLIAQSCTGRDHDVASGGNLFVVCASMSKGSTMVYRFMYKYTAPDMPLLMPLPDMFIKNHASYFVRFNRYCPFISLYNSVLYVPEHEIPSGTVALQAIGDHATGMRMAAHTETRHISIPGSTMRPLCVSSVSGTLLVPGDFGILVHE